MPLGSSVGWFGCRRTASRPGRPMVLRKRVTTRHLRATRIRSWLRISLLTAAAISGVMPGAHAGKRGFVGRVRQQPVAEVADGEARDRREGAAIVAVDDQPRDLVRSRTGPAPRRGSAAAARRPGTCAPPCAPPPMSAARPARTSPERGGVALAITSLRSRNCQRWPSMVCRYRGGAARSMDSLL